MGFKEDLLGASSQVTIGEVQLDAGLSEEHEVRGGVTSSPVETGIDVTDNYRVKPRMLSINGIITNTPIAVGYPLQTAINGVKNIAAGNDQPTDVAWAALQEYLDKAQVIDITTSLQKYTNMVITSLVVKRNSQHGQSLNISLKAMEVRFVTTELTGAIPYPKEPRGQDQKDKGKDTNKDANKGQNKKSESMLKKGKNWIKK
jgi:hypothetical protein